MTKGVLLAAMVIVLLASSDARAARSRCEHVPPRAELMVANARVSVHRYGRGPNFDYRLCDRVTGQTVVMADHASRARRIVVAGRFVAWFYEDASFESSRLSVKVIDATEQKFPGFASSFDIYNSDGTTPTTNAVSVTDLALTRDGVVAWIATRPYPEQRTLEVHTGRYVAPGTVPLPGKATLAVSDDIVKDSLAVSRHNVYWTQGDGPHAAAL